MARCRPGFPALRLRSGDNARSVRSAGRSDRIGQLQRTAMCCVSGEVRTRYQRFLPQGEESMLTNDDLSSELEALSRQARELAGAVKNNGDLPARQLAVGIVEAGKIGEKLAKLSRQLRGGNGNGR